MEGIVAVAARMAEIRRLVAGPTVPTAAVAVRPATAGASAAAFAAVLADQVAATPGAAATAAVPSVAPGPDLSPSSVRRINGDPLPAALAGYQNGRLPEAALTPVGDTGHRLFAPAAEQLERLLAAARADGVTIGITDSYRTYDTQVDLVRRKGLYSQGGLAATPGTSDHGWGMAVDLRLDDRAQAWMRANGAAFGFAEDTPREPWHWAFQT